MFQALIRWFSQLWESFRKMLQPEAPWQLDAQSLVQPQGFVVRIAYQVAAGGGPPLYVRAVDDAEDGRFLTMAAILPGGRGEVVIPVDSLHIPDGRRYRCQIVTGDGAVQPKSPTVLVDVPAYPHLGGLTS